MKNKKTCVIVLTIVLLMVAIYYCITGSIENQQKKLIKQTKENSEYSKKNEDYNKIYSLYDDVSDMAFISEDGKEIGLNDFKNKNVIFTYWDSAFDDSKYQILNSENFKMLSEGYEDIEYILVHRSDENNIRIQEDALKYLKEKNIDVQVFFDKGMKIHGKLGLKSVPATFSVDKDGRLVSLKEGMIQDENSFKSVIDKTRNSAAEITENFIRENMINDEGGINITLKKDSNSEENVLSESQGIMIEYAGIKDEPDLFDSALNYINKYMKNDNLISWKVENGEASRVNAAIDDLRVYDALYNGTDKFGVKEKELKDYSKSIYKYNVENGNLVDCYDFANNQKSQRLTLCYGDFNALGELWAENWRFKKVYNNTLEKIKNGYISDEFPLYYSWYNYESGQYERDDLNTSEALVTILHLSEIGEVKPETINWLKEKVNNGTLYGRYTVEGKVSEGYEYESTAAYALAALIGKQVGDSELINNAVLNMEKMRINDSESEFYGAFGNLDGSGIYSFDQCMALLAYAELEK